jgi:uncharacterized protein
MVKSSPSAIAGIGSTATDMPVSESLLILLRATYRLDWNGIHGVAHWARVRENGLRLASVTHANLNVVQYFAFLHDACRHSDGRDADHGRRAARLACAIRDRHIELGDTEFNLLVEALSGHTDGTHPSDVTVATCWDADRLDLGRVDIVPDPRYLHTEAGRDPATIQWALNRSLNWRRKYLERRKGR